MAPAARIAKVEGSGTAAGLAAGAPAPTAPTAAAGRPASRAARIRASSVEMPPPCWCAGVNGRSGRGGGLAVGRGRRRRHQVVQHDLAIGAGDRHDAQAGQGRGAVEIERAAGHRRAGGMNRTPVSTRSRCRSWSTASACRYCPAADGGTAENLVEILPACRRPAVKAPPGPTTILPWTVAGGAAVKSTRRPPGRASPPRSPPWL